LGHFLQQNSCFLSCDAFFHSHYSAAALYPHLLRMQLIAEVEESSETLHKLTMSGPDSFGKDQAVLQLVDRWRSRVDTMRSMHSVTDPIATLHTWVLEDLRQFASGA
jgi:hypothetical protein